MFPTVFNAPEVVSALRETPQFSRVTTPKLYRLLERAPTLNYGPEPIQLEQEQQLDDLQQIGLKGKLITGPALYYVLEGELEVSTNEHEVSLGVGEFGGPDLFDASPLIAKASATAKAATRAVVLTQRAITAMMHSDPGFARALGPHAASKQVNP
jgi:CRP-like cAMP-binding protein